MKKIFKTLSCLLLSVMMLCAMMPVTASADAAFSYDKNLVIYHSNYGYGNISIGGLTSTQTISKSSVKTSNKNVVSLQNLSRYTSTSKYQYWNGQKDSSSSNYSYNISLNTKATGKAKISWKIGSKTYSTNVTVLKYTNPLKSMVITGLKNGTSSNLAGLFKNTNSASGTLAKTTKNATVKITAASGWKITNANYNSNDLYRNVSSWNGTSSVTLHPGTMTKNSYNSVYVTLRNTKTGGTVTCSYSFH